MHVSYLFLETLICDVASCCVLFIIVQKWLQFQIQLKQLYVYTFVWVQKYVCIKTVKSLKLVIVIQKANSCLFQFTVLFV